jgi:drug/metabolite transporter (DMT)-like permease
MTIALIYALLANLTFSSGSILFTKYSRIYGALKFNTYKASLALICFFAALIFYPLSHFPNEKGIILLAISGISGLAVGDIFLFTAFKHIGAARTLTLFSFRPIIIALLNYLVLDLPIKNEDSIPTLFFILCLFIFAKESYSKSKQWDLAGISLGLLGVLLDSVGVFLTRIVFDENSSMTTFHANFVRTLFAVIVLHLIILVRYKKINIIPIRDIFQDKVLFASPIVGTFIALLFFIQAIKTGSLIVISAIGITGPIFASLIECFINKEKPSAYLIWAFIFFILGMLMRTYLML